MDYWPGSDWVRRYNRGFHEAVEDVVLQVLIGGRSLIAVQAGVDRSEMAVVTSTRKYGQYHGRLEDAELC